MPHSLKIFALSLALAIRPSLTRAGPIDPASPRGAALAFYKALQANDVPAISAAFVATTDDEKTLIQAFANQLLAINQLTQAAKARFNAAGDSLTKGLPLTQSIAQLESAPEKIEADQATISLENASKPLHLIKRQGQWKIPVSDYAGATPDNIAAQIAILNDMTQAFKSVATDITADKFPSAADAQRALQQKIQAVLFTSLQKRPPTTQATTQSTK